MSGFLYTYNLVDTNKYFKWMYKNNEKNSNHKAGVRSVPCIIILCTLNAATRQQSTIGPTMAPSKPKQ